MPTTKLAHLGRIVSAGLLGLAATGAIASPQSQVVVSQQSTDTRAVQVEVADLDLGTSYDRDTLAVRIDDAARHVCDVYRGSKLDELPSAKACLNQARSGALAQLEARGLDGRQLAMVSFGGMQ